MEVLLDTHALVWWFSDPAKLSKRASDILTSSNNAVLTRHTEEQGFTGLPISIPQATKAGLLPLHHGDPFDRLLVAQAQALNIPILSADKILDRCDIKRIWQRSCVVDDTVQPFTVQNPPPAANPWSFKSLH